MGSNRAGATRCSILGPRHRGGLLLAHHLTFDDDKRQLMIAALRYYDTFVKMDGSWLFAERLLYVD